MPKTQFIDGETPVNAAWLNKHFGANGHVHDGQDEDGHAPKIDPATEIELGSDIAIDAPSGQIDAKSLLVGNLAKIRGFRWVPQSLQQLIVEAASLGSDAFEVLVNGTVQAQNTPKAMCRFRFGPDTTINDVTYALNQGITKIERVVVSGSGQAGWYDVWLADGPGSFGDLLITASVMDTGSTHYNVKVAGPSTTGPDFSIRLLKLESPHDPADEVDIALTAYWS